MTLFPPSGFAGILLALALMVVAALAFYAIGKWLRQRGHGDRLDAIDAAVTSAQHRSLRMLGPFAASVTRLGRAFHSLPIVGSRRQRKLWNDLDADMHARPSKATPKRTD